MKLNKLSAVIFIMSVILALSSSCQTNDVVLDGGEGGISESGGANQEDVPHESEAEAERLYPDLEPVDFEGYEFTFLARTLNDPDWAEWGNRDFFAESETGDTINDAVYSRNRKIEQKYNITITEIVMENDAFYAGITRAVNADDDIYDAVGMHFNHLPAQSQRGNLADVFSIPHLNLSQPWWNQGSMRDLSVNNRLFLLRSDLQILDNDAMEVIIFNKDLLKEHALEDPYQLVKKGEWTFEKLMELGRTVSKDLNGDGQMNIHDDLFGYILQADSAVSFYVSGGEKIASKDESDLPVITFGSERGYRITEYLSQMLADTENSVNLHSYEGRFPIYDEQVKMFSENRALFSWIRMRIVERLRGMETDFGILPLPKLDKEQEKYITHVNSNTGAGISVPVSAGNLDRTGMILEDLTAESRYTLQPAYYEINLIGKYARDDESREMIDIILSNTTHDIGRVYNFGEFASSMSRYGRDMVINWASQFESLGTRMQNDINRTIEAYEKLD